MTELLGLPISSFHGNKQNVGSSNYFWAEVHACDPVTHINRKYKKWSEREQIAFALESVLSLVSFDGKCSATPNLYH